MFCIPFLKKDSLYQKSDTHNNLAPKNALEGRLLSNA